MIELSILLRRTLNLLSVYKSAGNNAESAVRQYSVFPQTYHKPVFRKDEQEELVDTDEAEVLKHIKIKPAFTSESSSEFYDPLIVKFTNHLMKGGNKQLARKLIDQTFMSIKRKQVRTYHLSPPHEQEQIELDPRKMFHRAVINCTPVLELTRMRRGGIIYQIPTPLTEKKAVRLAQKWLIQSARSKKRDVRYVDALGQEIIDAANNLGSAIRKKHELHKLCDANRAYAHFRWTR